eukprot:1326348-Pleurochrysis_carterae.AAC.1
MDGWICGKILELLGRLLRSDEGPVWRGRCGNARENSPHHIAAALAEVAAPISRARSVARSVARSAG